MLFLDFSYWGKKSILFRHVLRYWEMKKARHNTIKIHLVRWIINLLSFFKYKVFMGSITETSLKNFFYFFQKLNLFLELFLSYFLWLFLKLNINLIRGKFKYFAKCGIFLSLVNLCLHFPNLFIKTVLLLKSAVKIVSKVN